MTIPEIATQVSKELSKEGLKELTHRLMCDAMDRMCQRFRPGYRDNYKSELWSMTQEVHKEWASKVRGIVSSVLTQEQTAGKLVLTDVQHLDAEGKPTGVVRQGDVLRSLIDLLNDIKDDSSVPANTRAQVFQSLLRVAEQIDTEQTETVVMDFSDAWPDSLRVAAEDLDEQARKCVERLSGGVRQLPDYSDSVAAGDNDESESEY